jgi:formyltetrahydrofolate deformylase
MIRRRLCGAIVSVVTRGGGHRGVATMRVWGPDKNGLVATSTELLYRSKCTILQSEHFSDKEEDMFFQRIVFDHNRHPQQQHRQPIDSSNTSMKEDTVDFEKTIHEMELSSAFQDFKQSYEVNGDIDFMRHPKRIAIFVSKLDHCLWELLLRYQAKELARYGDCVISLVISNHEVLRSMVEDTFRIPFLFMPKTYETKLNQEDNELKLCQEYNIDLIVLARYMQILSPKFLHQDYPIINIHHSFLPAFLGRRAYHQAHDRGVKLIGATVRFCYQTFRRALGTLHFVHGILLHLRQAHYTTIELDQGPIIEQDVIPVSHRDNVADFRRKGCILERSVLVRAVQAHLANRVIVYKNKCVIFGD